MKKTPTLSALSPSDAGELLAAARSFAARRRPADLLAQLSSRKQRLIASAIGIQLLPVLARS